ncbi:MAG: hypothetical protein CVV33_06065 [Methanomicrobiales archaeon HGW-Methanomicrobiales-4]|nr:MAG: hypothetical protein CVV33_06065 [Methanomicrobiales archaeon HGW-Methanomicrobiales-4]
MRRYHRIPAGCLTVLILVLILVLPATALNITYLISEDGSGYRGVASVNSTDRFDFVQSGMLGERVPLTVTNISLYQDGSNVSYSQEREGIRFPLGNYTIGFEGKMSGNTFQTQYSEFGNVTIVLPEKFKVDNPLLTSLQPGGANISRNLNQTIIHWEKARYLDIRFYDAGQESLLSIFGQFWLIIAVMLLLPFLFSRGRQG